MGIQISGSIQILVTRDDEDAVEETVTGFGLEQAPDDIRPSDDGLYYFDAIYKAYADDYAIELGVSVNGNEAEILSIEIVDLHANVFAEITSDDITVSFNGRGGDTGAWLNA